MQLNANYPTISLDTIANSASYFSGKWNSDLKRNQSRDLLTLLLNKLYWLSRSNIFHGNPFHARTQASHAALGATLDLSREWVCKLVARLRDDNWITTHAPRKPQGKYQEITIFRPGKRLKRLLVMLRKSHQRQHSTSVNTESQNFPTKEEREENKARFAELIAEIGKNKDMKKAIRW